MAENNTIPTKEQEYDGSTFLKSVLQEAFTDNILAGEHQNSAYMIAYPNCKSIEVADAAASRLLRNVRVKARLDYKRAELAKKLEITEDSQVKRFRELSERAEQDGQFSAAVSAEDRITTICGLYKKDNAQKEPKTIVEILAIVGINKDKKAVESEVITG